MKKNLFIYIAFITMTMVLSCKKENKKEIPRFLDINMEFSGASKPEPGATLILNLHYEDVRGKAYGEIPIGDSQSITLNQEMIDQGFRVTFEAFPKEDAIYLSAYVDVDKDGEVGTGDFAMFYPDITFSAIELEEGTPQNITTEYAISLDLNAVIGGAAGGLIDIDGNVYETVLVGGREWMKENLKVTKYRDGTPINTGLDDTEWAEATLGAYAVYPYGDTEGVASEEQMIAEFGLLYNWYAVDNPKGLCPEGWEVPSDNDWKDLERTIGMSESAVGDAGWRGDKAALLMRIEGWGPEEEAIGTDEYGFSAIPAGARYPNGSYKRFETYAYFWTSTPSGTQGDKGIRRLLKYDNVSINRSNRPAAEGQGIRCVRIQ